MGTLCGQSLVTFSCYARPIVFLPMVKIYKAQILFFLVLFPWYITYSSHGRKVQEINIPFSTDVTQLYAYKTSTCMYLYTYSVLQICLNILDTSYCLCMQMCQ